MLMRRSLSLLLGQQGSIGHAALSDLVETSLTFHAGQYFIRGMRVVNDLTARRKLPSDCRACWDRFQADLRPESADSDRERWRSQGYTGHADAHQTDWIETTCEADDRLFVNAGRKEDQAAKDLARLSLERLRRDLATYTVNRIVLAIAYGLCERLALQFEEPRPTIDETYERLDAWMGDSSRRAVLAYAWRQRIEELGNDPGLPGAVVEQLPERLKSSAGDPAALEGVIRELVSEAILSSRAFTRYIELMNSLLGGGALPTNQDAKGMMARGGSQSLKFHLTLNDRLLELLVSLAALESRDPDRATDDLQGRRATSLQGFLEFIQRRFHLVLTEAPAGAPVPSGLVAAASMQSVSALKSRLSSMGLLEEYSDSLEWTRLVWGERT